MKTMKLRSTKKIMVLLMAVVMLAVGVFSNFGRNAGSVEAAYKTPKLVVTGADISGGSVKAGDNFTMTIHLKNESKTKLGNISLKLSSEDSQITTVSGSDCIYIDSIDKEEETDVEVELSTRGNLEQKNYAVNIEYSYEDNSWNVYDETASVTVPVTQDSSASISEKRLTKNEIEVDGKTSLSFKVNNTGKATIYNISTEITGDTISDISTYIGSIEVGQSGTVDLSLTGEQVGSDSINVKVTYEDAEGNKGTVTDEIDFNVTEQVVEEASAEETPNVSMAMIGSAGIIAVILLVIIFSVIRRVRDKKYE